MKEYDIHQKKHLGFTIVELLVVVAVIGVLAAFSAVGYNGWRARSAQNEVKSDLKNAATAMESAKNFGSGYPSAVPTNFQSSPNVTVSLHASSNTAQYCLTGTSTKVSAAVFNIRNGQTEPSSGVCTSVVTP